MCVDPEGFGDPVRLFFCLSWLRACLIKGRMLPLPDYLSIWNLQTQHALSHIRVHLHRNAHENIIENLPLMILDLSRT